MTYEYNYSQTPMGHDVHQFHASNAGDNVLIFGAIHGDEVCGPMALAKMIDALKSGDCQLAKGSVTMIPVCNLQAYQENKRYIDENLNRVFAKTDDPQSLEAAYANILMPYIEASDVLIDLHSTAAGGAAFVFDDQETEMSGKLTECLPLPYILTGWDALYPDDQGISTITAADHYGCVGICIENGQHQDAQSVKTAEMSVMSVLHFLGVVECADTDVPAMPQAKKLHMTEVVFRQNLEAKFTKEWQNFDKMRQGEEIAICPNNGVIKAPYDGYLIMPKATAEIGEEWFYFAQEKNV